MEEIKWFKKTKKFNEFFERLNKINGGFEFFSDTFKPKCEYEDCIGMCGEGMFNVGNGFYGYKWNSDVSQVILAYLFGNKKESIRAYNSLLEWGKKMSEKEHMKIKQMEMERKIEKINNKTKGFIYLIKSLDLYKIGRAKTEKRIETYRTENPHELKLLIMVMVDDYVGVEKFLLEKYKNKQFQGEWFKLDKNDVNEIKNILKNYEKKS